MNPFDSAQDAAFNIVVQTMGYPATWTPLAGGAQITATVLFNNPTAKFALFQQADYMPNRYFMEYKFGDLIGLKESVDNSNDEIVNVNGIDYYTRSCSTKYDGKTIIVVLEPKI